MACWNCPCSHCEAVRAATRQPEVHRYLNGNWVMQSSENADEGKEEDGEEVICEE